jgi:hypothetical protein
MVPIALVLSLAAPTPLGRMASLDTSEGYEQLHVSYRETTADTVPVLAARHHRSADAPAVSMSRKENGTPSKQDANALVKAAKKAEAEGRKAERETARAEARQQLAEQKERERALAKAQAEEERRGAKERLKQGAAQNVGAVKENAAQAEPLVRSTQIDDPTQGVNWAQEKRKAARAEELGKLKEQKEREKAAQKEANKAERQRLSNDARDAQKRLAEAQRGAGDSSAPAAAEEAPEVVLGKSGAAERAEAKAQAKAQRDAERAAAKAQNAEERARAKAQNDAERARAKEQTDELKKDNEKQRFREAQGRYEAAIATTERVADQKRASKGPNIPVQTFDDTGRCPVVGSCGGGDLGVMPDTENNDAGGLPSDDPLCVGSNCNGGGGGSLTDGGGKQR